jgi:hypothetical protein
MGETMTTFIQMLIATVPLSLVANSQPLISDQHSNGALEMAVTDAKGNPDGKADGRILRGILTIKIRNVSSETLTVIATNPECDYMINISDASGNPPRQTELGQRLLPKSDAERADCPVLRVAEQHLKPGDVMTEEWDLNRLFHLDPAKSYGVTIARIKGLPAATPSGRSLRRTLAQTLSIK